MRPTVLLLSIALATAPLSSRAEDAAGAATESGTAAMRVVVVPPVIDGTVAAADREALLGAVRRGLASDSYELVDDAETRTDKPCKSAICRHALAQRHDATHLVELYVSAEPRNYAVELRVYGSDPNEPFATASGTCEICGLVELEQMIASKADAVRQRLTSQELAPAVIAVSSTPSGSTVRIDGTDVGVTPYSGELQPGSHTVEVVRGGFFTERRKFTAARGVRERVHMSLASVPHHSARRIVGWAALGVGLASLAGGATMLALDGREYGPRCKSSGARDADGDCKWVHRTLGGGVALTVAGATLTATGVTLLLVDRRRHKTYPLRASISPRRVALSFRF